MGGILCPLSSSRLTHNCPYVPLGMRFSPRPPGFQKAGGTASVQAHESNSKKANTMWTTSTQRVAQRIVRVIPLLISRLESFTGVEQW